MKKSFLLLPLVVTFALTACTSNNSAEVTESSSDTLSNGGTWQPADIQPTSMPSGMNQPISQPSYTPAPVTAKPAATAPSYNNTSYNNTSYNNNASYGSSDSLGNCQVVRDAAGTPIYAQMAKGCYTDSTITVGPQDTLYFVSFLAGKTPAEIAALNNISTTTKLKVGQTLRVR